MQIIGYVRTSTDEQTNGMEAQADTLRREAEARSWALDLRTEHATGKTLARRPVLRAALDELDAGRADALVVSKLDRLARSTLDFAAILERAQRNGWSVVVLDLGLDLSTTMGRFAADLLMRVAQLEREMISDRTRDALAVVKRRGAKLGKPSTVPADVVKRISRLRSEGRSWREVAGQLEADDIPGPGGGRWYAASARRVHMRSRRS